MLDDRQISDLVQSFYRFELDDENRMRLCGVRFDEPNRQAAIGYYERFARALREALARNDLASADSWVADLLAREGIEGEMDALTRAKLSQGVLRASCDLASAMKKRFEGDFNHEPQDHLLVSDGQMIVSNEGTDLSRPKRIDPTAPLFSVRAEEFRQMRERRGIWDGQTALQARKTFQLFAELCGDRQIASYQRDDAVRFKNLLCDLPVLYGKAARYRGMRAVEIAEISTDSGEPRLSARTVQRHLSALSCLWDEELEANRLEINIFKNFKLPAAKRPKDQRSMWPSSKLKLLFDTPVWRGCKSKDRRSAPGSCIIRDERFWLPLIGVFSGMRQEEICQLELGDLRQEEGVWVFDIHGRGERNVKNLTAVRLVPVHSELIGIGLLTYAEYIRKAGHKRLFPGMERGGADQRYGHNFAKWFSRYRRDVGLYEPGLDFHSFRHSATTFMAQAGVASEVIDRVTGHVTAGETARYTKQFRIGQLQSAIEAIDPGVDLSFLCLDLKPAGGSAWPQTSANGP